MRKFHRILSILAVLVMLYLGVTGTVMQLYDLNALFSHAPQTDPVMQSINEGRYGNGDTAVVSPRDLTAQTLPAGFDYAKAFDTTLAAMHAASPAPQPHFVEVRVVNGQAVGQVKLGQAVNAFNAQTGAPVSIQQPPPFEPMPPSVRQSAKELHRFWSMKDKPGVYFELTCGIVLWILIISGLWMYYKLLSARMKIGRNAPFWMGGGVWKSLHRIISVAASIFIIAIAFTGTWLGFESTWHTFIKVDFRADATKALSDDQVRHIAAAALADFRKAEPTTPIKVLRVRNYGGMNQGAVVTGGPVTRQILYNADTGAIATLTEPGYPESGFPFGTQVHENIKHFHSGDMFGIPTRVMNLLAGLALIYLSVSGIVMYVQLWLRRKKNGKTAPVWL